MGIFDFVASAGEKLMDAALPGTAAEDIESTVVVSPERLDQLRKESITKSLAALDIEGEEVSVTVAGEIASLSGSAPSQEALEKMVLCAGNQHGISQVDCQLKVSGNEEVAAQASEAAAESTFYTVQSGDTLGKIAAEHYGNAGKYTVIFEANKPMLTDPDKIYPGQKLRIPKV
jgi:nucleoid-associated protein YgaU